MPEGEMFRLQLAILLSQTQGGGEFNTRFIRNWGEYRVDGEILDFGEFRPTRKTRGRILCQRLQIL